MVTWQVLFSEKHNFMRCSLIPTGREGVSFIKLVLMAIPNPCSLSSSAGFSHQKMVQPAPAYLCKPLSASLITLNAAILMLYQARSFAIKAVLLSGLGVMSLSSNAWMFQAPRMNHLSFEVCFVVLVWLLVGWSASHGKLARCGRAGNVLGTFVTLPSCEGGQCCPEEGCPVSLSAAECLLCLCMKTSNHWSKGHLCAGFDYDCQWSPSPVTVTCSYYCRSWGKKKKYRLTDVLHR